MMRRIFNWQYEDVVAVLQANDFIEQTSHNQAGTSHHYFVSEDGQKLVHVQYHVGKSIRPKTLESIILTSGLPKSYWMKCAVMTKRQLKKSPYKYRV